MWSTWPTSSQSDATVPSIPVARNTVREVGPVLVQRGALHPVVVRATAQCGGRRDARGEWADAVNGKAATFEAEPAVAYPGHCGHAKRFGFRAPCGRMENSMECPNCGLLNPPISLLTVFSGPIIIRIPPQRRIPDFDFHFRVRRGTIRGVVVPTFEQRHAL